MNAAKQEILDRVTAALDFLPDDPAVAEQELPWLTKVLNISLDELTYGKLNAYVANAANALFGPLTSGSLRGDGDAAGFEGPVPQVTHLRAV